MPYVRARRMPRYWREYHAESRTVAKMTMGPEGHLHAAQQTVLPSAIDPCRGVCKVHARTRCSRGHPNQVNQCGPELACGWCHVITLSAVMITETMATGRVTSGHTAAAVAVCRMARAPATMLSSWNTVHSCSRPRRRLWMSLPACPASMQ